MLFSPLQVPRDCGQLSDALPRFLNPAYFIKIIVQNSWFPASQTLTAFWQCHIYSRSISLGCCRSKLVRNECSRFGFIELIPCWKKMEKGHRSPQPGTCAGGAEGLGWVRAHEAQTLHLPWSQCPGQPCALPPRTCPITGTGDYVKYASVAIKVSAALRLQMCCACICPHAPVTLCSEDPCDLYLLWIILYPDCQLFRVDSTDGNISIAAAEKGSCVA